MASTDPANAISTKRGDNVMGASVAGPWPSTYMLASRAFFCPLPAHLVPGAFETSNAKSLRLLRERKV
jgi:hypothetical protein